MKKRKTLKGFTLIEMIIVVAVFGMRLLFPIAIVSIFARISILETAIITITDVDKYTFYLTKTHAPVMRPRTFGQIDVRRFLTPDSAESLMFEDYTGPAAIYEFDDKTNAITLIRANKKFLKLFEFEKYLLYFYIHY